jgi:hypothetical protein
MDAIFGVQLIFSGKTADVHPDVPGDGVLFYEHNATHWSNETTTLALLNDIIGPYVERVRAELQNPTAPVLVIADVFRAHWTPAVMQWFVDRNIVYLPVPGTLTHLFQPLDLGAIAGMKGFVVGKKNEFMSGELRTAMREERVVLLSRSRPMVLHFTLPF